jgi:Ni,Fe-hydrogenase III large subunit
MKNTDNNSIDQTVQSMRIHYIPQISQDSSLITPVNITEYLQRKHKKQKFMTNIPISRLFYLLERERPLISITRQIHLSETIELITGIFIPENIREYRGLLLNLERSTTYFYIFHKFFYFLGHFELAKIAYTGYFSFQRILETLWQFRFPWGIIRTGGVLKSIYPTVIPEIQKLIRSQQKCAWKIAKFIEKNSEMKKKLISLETLNIEEAIKLGITGPIARSLGVIPSSNAIKSDLTRKSAISLIQNTYTNDGNIWAVFRVCCTELILSLGRALQLLKPYSLKSQKELKNSIDGEATTSFTTALGQTHLTVSISNDQASYFNYIPPEMVNMAGITRILTNFLNSHNFFIFLFFDPRIIMNQGEKI